MVERRRDGVGGIKPRRAELVQNVCRSNWKILREQPVSLGEPLVVSSIKLIRAVRVLVNVAPVITPTGRLGNDGKVNLGRSVHPACHDLGGRQRAVVEKVFVHAVRKIEAILRVGLEFRVQARRGIGAGDPIEVGVEQQGFADPGEILKHLARRATADCVPVLVDAPVLMSDVEVQQHVVDVLRHIEVLLHQIVFGVVGQVGDANHRVVRRHVAVHELAFVHHVVICLCAAEIFNCQARIGPFSWIVNAPVKPVDVKVNVAVVRSEPAHRALRILHECVTGALGAGALRAVPVDPGSVEIGPQR